MFLSIEKSPREGEERFDERENAEMGKKEEAFTSITSASSHTHTHQLQDYI